MTKTEAQRLDPHAEPDGFIINPNSFVARAATVVLVKNIADLLERHYPGWLWAVQPDERGGVINIFSLRLSGQWGWRIKTKNIQNDPTLKLALEAGGEILERFGQRRGPYNYARWANAPRKFGLLDFDISDKDRKTQRRRNDDDFTDAIRRGDMKLRYVDRKTATGTHRQIYVQPSAMWDKRNG